MDSQKGCRPTVTLQIIAQSQTPVPWTNNYARYYRPILALKVNIGKYRYRFLKWFKMTKVCHFIPYWKACFLSKRMQTKFGCRLLANQHTHRVCRVNKFLSRADLSPNEWNELNFCSCVVICFQFTSVKEMFSWHLLSKG